MKKETVVVHSGGMDSSLCLALAIRDYGAQNVLSLSFSYGQRHSKELEFSQAICQAWGVDHLVIDINCLEKVTTSALLDSKGEVGEQGRVPDTLVVGRNGLMARIAGIHADSIGADSIYMGIIEVEEANSGYRDCSRKYMDIVESALRIDFAKDQFSIKTPLVYMTKKETMKLGSELGRLEFLLENTLSCYNAVEKEGCLKCPACDLRNKGIKEFLEDNPRFELSYKDKI